MTPDGATRNADGSYTKDGITYSVDQYHVTITVYDNGDGTLAASKVIHKVGQSDPLADDQYPTFTNTYAVTGEAKLPLSGTKTLLNRDLQPGEFRFALKDEDGEVLQTVHNHADGSFAFEDLVFTAADLGKTFVYTVTEVIPEGAVLNDQGLYVKDGVIYTDTVFTFTVKVADNGKGGIQLLNAADEPIAATGYGASFTNTYTTEPVTVDLSGKKMLDGRDLDDEEFVFQLVDVETGDVLQEKPNLDGKFTFDTITYTYTDQDTNDLGKHYYVIREKIPAGADRLGGVTYDASTYEIEVSVTDLNGVMSAKVTVTKPGVGEVDQDNILFTNRYAPEPKSSALSGSKEVSGRQMTANDVFTFSVYEGDELVATGYNTGSIVKFDEITYTQAGTHTYTIVEDIPEGSEQTDAGYIKNKLLYDSTVFTATVTVTDNGDGTLSISTVYDQPVKFVNTYVPDDINVEFDVKKTVENKTAAGAIGPNGFQFTLSENGQVIQTQLSDSNGDAKFSLSYGAADVGVHTYIIRETDTKKTGVTYDDTYYTVTVNVVRDTVTGDLSATYKVAVDEGAAQDVNNVEVGFHNTYEKSTTPQTGDPSTMLPIGIMMLLSAAVLAALLLLKKKALKKN